MWFLPSAASAAGRCCFLVSQSIVRARASGSETSMYRAVDLRKGKWKGRERDPVHKVLKLQSASVVTRPILLCSDKENYES